MEHLMTSDEVAEYLRVDVVTIRRLVNRGELTGYRVGGEYRFTESDLEAYLQRQRVSTGEGSSNDLFTVFTQLGRKVFAKDQDRFAGFTERSRKVLTLAQEEAQRLRHQYVGTEHLLLGLMREGEGVAAHVLSSLSVELNQVRSRVEASVGNGEHTIEGEVGVTKRVKAVMELAAEEARRLRHEYVGTEHLLLGLVREGEGLAAEVLSSLGVDLAKVRTRTMEILSAPRTVSLPPVPPESEALLAEGEQGLMCSRCGARSPSYFQHCFNCGQRLVDE